ncbi:RagB/SusD family nutrient uptake outer membrane protein [Chryseolinea sp. T2]|uniref:RagB/SusD family nutrient uptake outer membrane protein n=1 Tax=Chryseolinea sp. T2 TaxID=3129255 RepID=UPI0030789487
MKRVNMRRNVWVALGIMVCTFSCTNLDEELYSDVTADNFFKTDEEFIAALGQAYSSFGGIGNHSGLWSINELASDELVVCTKGGDWYDGGVLLQLHKHEFAIDNGFFNNAWTFLYGGINTCNRLIYQFEALDTDEADAFIAELRAVRALWYYWAVDAFGNIPLVVDFTDVTPPATKGRAEVYAFIEKELTEVIPLLPTAKSAATYGRMTKWVALAIRSKLYLNAGVFTGTPQWQKAVDDATEIIDKGGYSLELSYKANFTAKNSGSKENIFVYPYDQVFAQGFNWIAMTLSVASQPTYNLTFQPWNGYQTVEEFYNSYIDPTQNPGPQGPVWKGLTKDANKDGVSDDIGTVDDRLSNFIVGPQYNPDGTRTLDGGFEPNDFDGAPVTFTPQLNEIYPQGLRQAGARIGKYEFESGATSNMNNDFVIFRLADIILTKAEGLHRLGQPGALELVNLLRARAGVDPYPALTTDLLYAERGREMFGEMTRRQDQIRFGKWQQAWWSKEVKDAHYQLFPIPKQQIDANKELKQNPGYPGATGG